jgi:hypothetical protein
MHKPNMKTGLLILTIAAGMFAVSGRAQEHKFADGSSVREAVHNLLADPNPPRTIIHPQTDRPAQAVFFGGVW